MTEVQVAHEAAYTARECLYMASELSAKTWSLAFSAGGERLRGNISIRAGDRRALQLEIERAEKRAGRSFMSQALLLMKGNVPFMS